ncbi:aminopeptidase P family protein [Niallia endozanthoxylica]|uniref:Aminopeptidase P family protein n=2 Tax=Niallia endozanthoxylica TaxID=2036016 RepID=A0A5J5I0P2_9BACI|nr:aminopeptidase P family protein [Niallia endozanthoxylica]
MNQRWKKLENEMETLDLDIVLIYGKGIITQYGNLYYFGGYYPILRHGFVIKIKGQQPIAYYNTRADYYLAKEKGTIKDVRFVGTGDVIQAEDPLLVELANVINAASPKKVSIVGLKENMNIKQYEFLMNHIKGEIVDGTGMVAKIKSYKSPEEMEMVKNSFVLAEKSYAAFEEVIQPGKTCAEIAGEIERIARGNGAIDTLIFIEEGPFFLRKPTKKVISENALVTCYVELIDENGYWVEKGGLIAVGNLSNEMRELADACVQAMEEVKKTIKPGITVGEIAYAINKQIAHLDVKIGIWHGHGVGVDHDIPVISDNGTDVIEEGMVLSVHPNFANAKEEFGASIADVFIVTKDGAESLSKLPYMTYLSQKESESIG